MIVIIFENKKNLSKLLEGETKRKNMFDVSIKKIDSRYNEKVTRHQTLATNVEWINVP